MLTPKQQRFCQEYLIDLNGTQAAIRAGYSKKTANEQSSQLLAKLNIQTEISKIRDERAKATALNAQWVIENLEEVSQRCMQKVPVVKYDREKRCMKQVIDEDGEGVWQFDSAGANRALELLGKHLGMFTERHELTGDVNIKVTFKDDND
jgi:phage terminase small subunit